MNYQLSPDLDSDGDIIRMKRSKCHKCLCKDPVVHPGFPMFDRVAASSRSAAVSYELCDAGHVKASFRTPRQQYDVPIPGLWSYKYPKDRSHSCPENQLKTQER